MSRSVSPGLADTPGQAGCGCGCCDGCRAGSAGVAPGCDRVPALAWAGPAGCVVEPGSDLAALESAWAAGEPITLSASDAVRRSLPPLPAGYQHRAGPSTQRAQHSVVTVRVSDRADEELAPRRVLLRPATLVAGVGASERVDAAEIVQALADALRRGALARASLCALASVDARARTPGVREAAQELGVPVWFHPAARLARVSTANPSTVAASTVGTASVCEAAAVSGHPLRRRGALLVAKTRGPGSPAHCTVALARHAPSGRYRQGASDA